VTIDTLLSLLTGFFIGAIFAEIRWIARLRRFLGQEPQQFANPGGSGFLAKTAASGASVAVQLPGLRSLYRHLINESPAISITADVLKKK
jgi:hypothetical protein